MLLPAEKMSRKIDIVMGEKHIVPSTKQSDLQGYGSRMGVMLARNENVLSHRRVVQRPRPFREEREMSGTDRYGGTIHPAASFGMGESPECPG